MIRKLLGIFIVSIVLASCGGSEQKEAATEKNAPQNKSTESKLDENIDWQEALSAVAKIESFDGTRILEKGQGFFVGTNLLVTKYSLVDQATNVKVRPFNEVKNIHCQQICCLRPY